MPVLAAVAADQRFLDVLGVSSFEEIEQIGKTRREHPELSPVERGAKYMVSIITSGRVRGPEDLARRATAVRYLPLAERWFLRRELSDALDRRDDARTERISRALSAWERRFSRLGAELAAEA